MIGSATSARSRANFRRTRRTKMDSVAVRLAALPPASPFARQRVRPRPYPCPQARSAARLHAAVADLFVNRDGAKFMAKLVGEGTITQTCGRNVTTYTAKRPTAIRIDDYAKLRIGETSRLHVIAIAGAELLRGIHQGGESPVWTLAPNCADLADFGPALGSSDTGGADIARTLRAHRAGTCTVGASVLGHSTTKTITIN